MATPDKLEHPNRRPFEGILTVLDQPSDRPPSGAQGHRVILTRAAARAALPSLLGMAVAFKAGWDGHDARRKCGIITHADIVGDLFRVSGYLYDSDFPEVAEEIRTADMGMSYELRDAHVQDMTADIWTLTRVTFTGAAILLRRKAAYHSTCIKLSRPRPLELDGDAYLFGHGDEDLLELSSEWVDVAATLEREFPNGIVKAISSETDEALPTPSCARPHSYKPLSKPGPKSPQD